MASRSPRHPGLPPQKEPSVVRSLGCSDDVNWVEDGIEGQGNKVIMYYANNSTRYSG